MVRLLAVSVVLWAGCYDPNAAAGIPCGPGSACPTGQTCNASNVCVLPGAPSDGPNPNDAEPPLDASEGADASGIDAPIDSALPQAVPRLRGFTTADGNSTSTSIASPATTQVGDLLLAHVTDDGVMANTIPTPQGWTRLVANSGVQDAFASVIFYRYASNPNATYTFAFPNALNYIHLMAFDDVAATAPIDVHATASFADTQPPSAPSITTTRDSTLFLAIYTLDLSQGPFDDVPGMTEIFETNTGQLLVMAAFERRLMAGPTGDRVATIGNDPGPSISFSLALAPR